MQLPAIGCGNFFGRGPAQQGQWRAEPQIFSSAAYKPKQPVMADEPVAAPIPQSSQEPAFSEENLRKDYTEKPKNKLDVPAFLRK